MALSQEHRSTDFLPSESVPIVRLNPQTQERELVHLRWGLSTGGRLIHARSETVATRPVFRDAFRRRRCLLVVDSFDVGKGRGGQRSHVIQREDRRPFGVGAIWDRWEKGDGDPLESCAVITTSANELVKPINERMPAIIAEEDYDRWLDPDFFDLRELHRMMQPFPTEAMIVSAR